MERDLSRERAQAHDIEALKQELGQLARQLQTLRDQWLATPGASTSTSTNDDVHALISQAQSDIRELAEVSNALRRESKTLTSDNQNLRADNSRLQRQLAHLDARHSQMSDAEADRLTGELQRLRGAHEALEDKYRQSMRSESLRKALVFQKRYLLMLLGRFHEAEEATLAFVARLSGQPPVDARYVQPSRRALARFKKAAVALVALHRLAKLTRRWRHHNRLSHLSDRSPRAMPLAPKQHNATLTPPRHVGREAAVQHDDAYLARLERISTQLQKSTLS